MARHILCPSRSFLDVQCLEALEQAASVENQHRLVGLMVRDGARQSFRVLAQAEDNPHLSDHISLAVDFAGMYKELLTVIRATKV